MTRGRLRRVTGRERGTHFGVDPDTGELAGYEFAVGHDHLECYHEVWQYGKNNARRRRCERCGPGCDCHVCRRERGES